jgi:hypothetical protein
MVLAKDERYPRCTGTAAGNRNTRQRTAKKKLKGNNRNKNADLFACNAVSICDLLERMDGLLAKHFVFLLFGLGRGTPFLLGAGLAQALGMAAGIINAFGLVAVFGGLIGACISALSERHVGGVKTSLVIAAVGGLAWVIAQAMFAAGGTQPNLQLQAIN